MTVTVQEKKEFIRWFLKKYQMKKRESVWILNYLISHETMLNHVHFVEEAHYCPRAMIMSVTDHDGHPFRFYKGSIMTADAERSFHDLRLNPEEETYIQLNFPKRKLSPEYFSVLEENPYMPKDLHINAEDQILAKDLLDHLLKTSSQARIEKQIDEAIDRGDKETFLLLSERLKKEKV